MVPKLFRRNLFVLSLTGIFYIGPLPGQPLPALFFQSFAGGPPQRLLAFDREIDWGLDLSPDGKTLLYTQIDTVSSDLKFVSKFR